MFDKKKTVYNNKTSVVRGFPRVGLNYIHPTVHAAYLVQLQSSLPSSVT